MSDTSRNDEVMKYCFGDDAEFVAVKHYDRLQRELAEARELLIKCLSIMPVGYVPTHTTENLPEMIGDLAKALAEETTEREKLERELNEAREDAANQRRLADLALAHRDEIIKERDILELELSEMRERCEKLQEERNTLVRAFNSRGY